MLEWSKWPFFADLGSDIFRLLKYPLKTLEREVSVKVEKSLGGMVLKPGERMVRRVFGGCPKRKVCSFYQIESKTCIYGPYRYCGKYRSIIEQKINVDMP